MMWRKGNEIYQELMADAVGRMVSVGRLVSVMTLCAVMLSSCGVPDRALVLSNDTVTEIDTDSVAERMDDVQHETIQSIDGKMLAESTIFVHVCGAVQYPGVVEIPYGSRVADALEAAGGLMVEAAPDYVNLAARLEDGQQLYFPTAEEVILLRQQEAAAASGMVNINTAGTELLCTLPGIGEAKAADIIAYREQNGAFQSKEDIMQVSGIKQNAYDKLQAYITVD